MTKNKNKNTLVSALAVGTIVAVGGIGVESASAHSGPARPTAQEDCGTYSGEGCAPLESRIDLEPPHFSNPTDITNPLFPISALESVVLLGQVDGLPFRAETTLLP